MVQIIRSLPEKGTVSAKQVEEKAFKEYDEFNKTQRIVSDFDKMVKLLGEVNQEFQQENKSLE